MKNKTNLIFLDDVLKQSGLQKSTLYNLMRNGRFPKPVRIKDEFNFGTINNRRTAWDAEKVKEWNLQYYGKGPIKGNPLKLNDVIEKTGLPKSTLYRLIGKGEFPKPIKIMLRRSAWDSKDIAKWIESKLLNTKK